MESLDAAAKRDDWAMLEDAVVAVEEMKKLCKLPTAFGKASAGDEKGCSERVRASSNSSERWTSFQPSNSEGERNMIMVWDYLRILPVKGEHRWL